MKYLPRNRRPNPYSKKILFLLGVFVVGAVVFYLTSPVIVPLVAPVWKTENRVTRFVTESTELLRSKRSLVEENENLKERLASLELERLAQSDLSRALSREVEGISVGARVSGVLASVIVRPPQSPYDFLIVDVGSKDGVSQGAKVYMPEGLPAQAGPEIGRVAEVFSNQSRVQLLTSSGVETSAVLERHGVPVILEGVGGGNFRAKVHRETEVVAGDRILSAGLDGNLLAVVGNTELQPTDAFKDVLAKSPASIFTLRFVTIINE